MTVRCQVLPLNPHDRETALCWNDLWRRGGMLPISRFEHVMLWKRHFAPAQRMTAIILDDEKQWLAALPLVTDRLHSILPVWRMPGNDWSWCGELLWNVPSDAADEAMNCLMRQLRRLGRCWTWLDPVPNNSAGWQQMRETIRRREHCQRVTPCYTIGQIRLRDVNGSLDMDRYQSSWSGNFRRQMRKMLRRANELGGVQLLLPRPENDQAVAEQVRRGFAVEDHGWKNRAGTSVLCRPRILSFFVEQAQQLARDGQLKLVFLIHQGQPIAFEYGWVAKGIYYSPKVGYDERFQHLSPGQLLRYHLIEHLLSATDCHTFDFLGPLSEATAKWATNTYDVDRLICSNGSWWGDLSLRWMSAAIPQMRSLWQSAHGLVHGISELPVRIRAACKFPTG